MAKKMTQVRRRKLQEILTSRRDELMVEATRQRRDRSDQAGSFADALDAASDGAAEDIAATLSEQKNEDLIKINDALARLEQGNYGNCAECGQEIAEKRLRALPFAVRCTECEEEREVMQIRQRQLAQRRNV